MENEPRDRDGKLIAKTEFEHSTMLAEKLSILGPIMDDDNKSSLIQQLHASAVVLFQQVTKSIGVLNDKNQGCVEPYLRREEPGYDGKSQLPRDRTRLSNIAKLNLALDTVTGTKDYSTVIKGLIDLERRWRKFPRTKDELMKTPQDWDLAAELVEITDSRNQLGVLSKKPVSEDASLKFSMAEHVKEALARPLCGGIPIDIPSRKFEYPDAVYSLPQTLLTQSSAFGTIPGCSQKYG